MAPLDWKFFEELGCEKPRPRPQFLVRGLSPAELAELDALANEAGGPIFEGRSREATVRRLIRFALDLAADDRMRPVLARILGGDDREEIDCPSGDPGLRIRRGGAPVFATPRGAVAAA